MKEKILIIQTAFLGDLILSTPFFHAIRKKHPMAEIHCLVNLGTEQILDGNPDLNKIITLNKKEIKTSPFQFFRFIGNIREENYDIVYSAHFSFRSSLISYFSGAKIRIGYLESGFSFLHTKKVSRPRIGPHEVEKLFSLVYESQSDYPKDRERRPFLFPKKDAEDVVLQKQIELSIEKQSYFAIAPSSLWETKRLPEEKFAELISLILSERLESIVILGSPSDMSLAIRILDLVKEINPNFDFSQRIINLAGKTNLSELAVWIRDSLALVSNDSSPVHYASAFNTPTVLVYGATIPGFGYYGLSSKLKIIEINGLDCRPCGIHGGRFCPKTHFKCMKDQSSRDIFEGLMEIL